MFTVALHIATMAHMGAKDKAGEDYIKHPIRVAMSLNDETCQCVALLHDVVENSEVTLELIEQTSAFGEEVLLAIDALTHREGEHYDDYISRVKANPIATKVKIADLRDNMDLSRLPQVTRKDERRCEKYRRALMTLQR